ncbi:MAG: helix-turn-helix domain-containing protein [Oscillospiraceae bacterium]|nr:helix-turn-helix domain-containing protein [Oscillospiraceae bacterium]
MNQVKIGKFIAELRKKSGLTQEQLGERIGVTNKTISRWETGNYMPSIDMLEVLAETFNVSINELLAGEVLDDKSFRTKADENVLKIARSEIFSIKEKSDYWKKKWRKEHIADFAISAVIALVFLIAAPIIFEEPMMSALTPIVVLIEYLVLNNRMMGYVEKHMYDCDE